MMSNYQRTIQASLPQIGAAMPLAALLLLIFCACSNNPPSRNTTSSNPTSSYAGSSYAASGFRASNSAASSIRPLAPVGSDENKFRPIKEPKLEPKSQPIPQTAKKSDSPPAKLSPPASSKPSTQAPATEPSNEPSAVAPALAPSLALASASSAPVASEIASSVSSSEAVAASESSLQTVEALPFAPAPVQERHETSELKLVGRIDAAFGSRLIAHRNGDLTQSAAQDSYKIALALFSYFSRSGLADPSGLSGQSIPTARTDRLVNIEGSITHLPLVLSRILGREKQAENSLFQLQMETWNPVLVSTDPSPQSNGKAIAESHSSLMSKWTGSYQVGSDGQARFPSNFKIINQSKDAQPFAFSGSLTKSELGSGEGDRHQPDTRRFFLEFRGLALSGGPSGYPATSVTGRLEYRSDSRSWTIQQPLVFTYESQGKRHTDTLTGTITAERSNDWTSSGRGNHHVNLRLNANRQSREEDYFADSHRTADEGTFFDDDPEASSITGTIGFRDTLEQFNGEPSIIQTSMNVSLRGKNLQPEQLMNFTKLWLLILPETYALAPLE